MRRPESVPTSADRRQSRPRVSWSSWLAVLALVLAVPAGLLLPAPFNGLSLLVAALGITSALLRVLAHR